MYGSNKLGCQLKSTHKCASSSGLVSVHVSGVFAYVMFHDVACRCLHLFCGCLKHGNDKVIESQRSFLLPV